MELLQDNPTDRIALPVQSSLNSLENQVAISAMKKATPHILLVDDDVTIRRCVRQYLELQGYDCTEADNGKIALHELAKRSFSLIITDNQMPTLDGISFLETYYHNQDNGRTPVIMVTGNLTDSLRDRAKQIGITKVFEKPCSFKDLENAIAMVI
ncbi:MAG: response regulator [Nitrospirales bacterium]